MKSLLVSLGGSDLDKSKSFDTLVYYYNLGGSEVQKCEHVLWVDVSNAAQVSDGEGEDGEVDGQGDLD